MKREVKLYLNDIVEAIELIENSTKGMTKKGFENNRDIQDATVRRMEIIGEAVKNIPNSLRGKYPDIEWKSIAGMRDVLIHCYFNVDVDKVWIAVKKNIPKLKKQVQKILESLGEN